MLNITDKKYFTYEITQRFLFAMDRILGNRSKGKVTAQAFGDIVGMKASNILRLRESTGENSVTVEAIGRLCDHYKVSAHWLITGHGNMWTNDELFAAYKTLESRMSEIEDTVKAIEILVGIKGNKVNNKRK